MGIYRRKKVWACVHTCKAGLVLLYICMYESKIWNIFVVCQRIICSTFIIVHSYVTMDNLTM